MEAIPISIAAKISEYLVAPIGRELGYFFQFTGNVETFTGECEKLRDLKAGVQLKVHVAENNVETILDEVSGWLNRVGSIEGEAQRIVEDKNRFPKGCLSGWLLNIKSRHGLSRRAKKITLKIVKLREEGGFTEVSIPAPLELFIGSTSTAFDSRERILNEIIKSLKDEDINMIGICGMGGVGKTTMVDEVLKRVKEENMFDDYAKTVVSQKMDEIKIQRDIAEMLGLRLEENNPDVRASRLNKRLDGKKVLIILDDVWDEFILEDLGFTLQGGQRKCKIVFTSRNQGLWRKFRSRRELSLDPLPFNESWNLFEENIGVLPDDKFEFVSIAEKIVRECAGLPLALVTLGSALLGKELYAWKDTLLKLEKIPGGQAKVYESIRQSYDYLGYEEAKSLFLLCSLFEEDSRILVESLVNMGMGLRLFEGINSVEEARDRVFTLVEHLQSRSLVTKKEAYITVHDVVRDVSKHIASTENGSLVLEQGVTWERWSLDKTWPENCTRISIISNEITEFPSQLQFPKLELLRCSNNRLQRIPDSCFEGMAKLQVLDINRSFDYINHGHYYSHYESWTVLKLPSSLQSLTSLHTLCLQDFRLEDFTAIKYLQNLDILRITDNHIKELPKEIGQLTKLRLLDMSYCKSLKRISSGIISGLTVLEELYLGGDGIDWGAEENEEGRIAAHKEFESLSNLYVLHIVIKDPRFLPLFTNLKKYKIQIGRVEYIYGSQNYERTLSISGVALEKDFKFLLHHSEAMLLKGESTKKLVYELVQEASQSIKYLWISETETPEYLANVMDRTKAPFLVSTLESLTLEKLDNLKQIINGPLVPGNFAKLKKLDVSKCKQLRNIFRVSNAVDVLHLEELRVDECESMEEVIWWEGREEEGNRKLQFPNLKKLKIESCKSLISFSKGANEIEFPQLEEMSLKSLPAVKTFFPPKVLFPKLVMIILENLAIVDGQLEAGSLVKLEELNVSRCSQLRNLFRLSTETHTVHLETLEIEECESMEEVIKWEGREEDATSKLHFPKLTDLRISGSGVRCFCRGAKEIEFHQLDKLKLSALPGVECLISGSNENPLKSMFPHKVLFPKLVTMGLFDMTNMKEIVDGPLKAGSFVKLKELNVGNCNQLRNIFRLPTETDTVHLEQLKIEDCERMEEVIKWEGREEDATSKLHFPELKELEIKGLAEICFCRGAKEIEFHQLDSLELYDLPGVECLISRSNENPLKSMFTHKVLFPKLVTMKIWYLNNMKEIVDGPLEAGSLVKLKELNVWNCNQLRNIFRLPTETDTVHLEVLEIEDCESMEEVIKWKGREEYATSKLHFPKLRKLTICQSGVICFCRGAKEIEFHQLEYLELWNLPGVECLISGSNENRLKSMFPHKVFSPKLVKMKLEFMRNVKEIWCGPPQVGSFCNLAELLIDECDSLKYVFSPFMATYLEHLHTLSIRDCPSLKEVSTAEKDKDVGEEYSSGFLPKLQSVNLIGLSALGRFCHIAHDLEFHVLSSVLVVNCPEFKTFAPGIVHAPNLKHVNIDEGKYHLNPGSETLWKENLNNTVQHLYEDQQQRRRQKQEDEKEGDNDNEINEDS